LPITRKVPYANTLDLDKTDQLVVSFSSSKLFVIQTFPLTLKI